MKKNQNQMLIRESYKLGDGESVTGDLSCLFNTILSTFDAMEDLNIKIANAKKEYGDKNFITAWEFNYSQLLAKLQKSIKMGQTS